MGILAIKRKATTPKTKPNTEGTTDHDPLDFSYLNVIAIFNSNLGKSVSAALKLDDEKQPAPQGGSVHSTIPIQTR
jgi:hypothetical protein